MGQPLKPPGMRQRRNKATTRAILPAAEVAAGFEVPPLPAREKVTEVWHPKVTEWWRAVWTSPMSAEYLASDVRGGLYILAELYQILWTAPNAKDQLHAAAEIRQQEIRFGLSPVDRHRLQWTIELGEKAEDATKTRRQSRELREVSRKDPRDVLKVVGSD